MLIKPVVSLYRWWRPEKHQRAVAERADDLAAKIDKAEDKLQQQLGAIPGSSISVTFTATTHPSSGEGIDSVRVDEIGTYFELLGQPRRMVVLGEPGAGKTVAATYLVRGLIQHRTELPTDARRAAAPVPVRVNTAGWDGGQDFTTWLVNRLNLDYQLQPVLGREMVERGLILPVLDGLDEMDDTTSDGARLRARALLDRLNTRQWAGRPVVVLCRSSEFEHLKYLGADNGLHGAATITLNPLPSGQPADYLTRYQARLGVTHPAWALIITHLREHPDSPLARTLQNPWMLGLTATTLGYTPQAAFSLPDCPTPDAVQDGLFAAQIPAAIANTADEERYRDYIPANVEKWLRSLARCLEHRRDTGRDGTDIRLDEIWEINGARRTHVIHILTVTLMSGLVVGLAAGVAFGLAFGLTFGLAFGLTFGVVGGLVFGFAAAMDRFPHADRIAWKVPRRTRWRVGLVGGLSFGLAVGLVGVLAFGFTVGGAFGLAGGLAGGIVVGLGTTAEDRLAMGTDERRLIRDDLQSALFHGGLFGLAVGLAFGLAYGLAFGLAVVFVGVFVGGLASGSASVRFFIAVLLFKFVTKDFPARPAAFLDWARRSGLLRVNATAYQFRHFTYQQWLLHRCDHTV